MQLSPTEATNTREIRWSKAVDAFRDGDKAGALYIFLALAKDGSKAAYAEIGNIYEIGGGGINQDFEKAQQWYKKSIDEADDVLGYIGLGRLYYAGKGVKQDFEKAFWYFSQTENNEKPVTFLMLGRMYHYGQGVQQDPHKARTYYQKAVNYGYVYALRNLGLLETESGHRLKGLLLRIRAVIQGIVILARHGQTDRRLSNC